jgi:phage protein D
MPMDITVPSLAIRINGAALPSDAVADIESVLVQEDVKALSMFTLLLRNWDDEKLQVTWSDSSLFAVGNEVEISFGFLDDLHRVMIGEITGLEPAFTAARPPTLTVRGYDHRHRLARGRATRTFAKIKDSAIARTVAQGAGLQSQVADSQIVHDLVVQSNQTDLEFLRERARLIGYEMYVQDKKLHFHPPMLTEHAAVVLQFGTDLSEFSPQLSSVGQVGAESLRSWDFRTKKAIVGNAKPDQISGVGGARSGGTATDRKFNLTSVETVVDVSAFSQAQADQAAVGQLRDRCLEYVRGEGECSGRPELRAGTMVQIDGVGKAFSGVYYLTGVSHQLTSGQGLMTTFEVRRRDS